MLSTPDATITREYDRVHAHCVDQELPEYLRSFTDSFRQGGWRGHWTVLQAAGVPLTGSVVLDLGCKYGHTIPLFVVAGATRVYALDVQQRYLEAGEKVFGTLYPATFLLGEQGYIPLAPETIDFVLVNEVISHVSPAYLDTVYSEIARVLRPGGAVFISDGNNWSNPSARAKLLELWEKWENGPDGVKTDRDTVDESYRTIRRHLAAQWYPALTSPDLDFFAANTSGLWGERLRLVAADFAASGRLVARPYRRGVYPTHPGEWGVVMERAFRPEHVELSLEQYGLRAHQLGRPAVPGSRRRDSIRHAVRTLMRGGIEHRVLPSDDSWRGAGEGFQILAFKDQ